VRVADVVTPEAPLTGLVNDTDGPVALSDQDPSGAVPAVPRPSVPPEAIYPHSI
jgi:hypothetical protein